MNNFFKRSLIGLLLLLVSVLHFLFVPSLSLPHADSGPGELEVWARTIQGKQVFSQTDEDGAIEAVFEKIGTTDKVYVEFGVENGSVCNSRHLRENRGWSVANSLLLDGGFQNPAINLQKVTV